MRKEGQPDEENDPSAILAIARDFPEASRKGVIAVLETVMLPRKRWAIVAAPCSILQRGAARARD